MKTRRLPGTELDLCGGLWMLGARQAVLGEDVDDATSAKAINAALDEGINWFDTAPLYGEGHADTILVDTLGQAQAQGHHRDQGGGPPRG